MLAKWFNKLQDIIGTFIGFMLGTVCVLIFIQVIMRYCFGRSLAWSEELARYMFIWVIYLGLNLTIREEMETKIELIDTMFKERGRIILKLIRYLITVVVIIACFFSSVELLKIGMRALTGTLRIPAWIPYMTFIIGFPMSLIEVLRRIYIYVKKLIALGKEGDAA